MDVRTKRILGTASALAGLAAVAAVHVMAGLQYAKDSNSKKTKKTTIKPYSPEHRSELEDVCIASASLRAREDKLHGEFTKMMYCDLYLDHGVAYMLENEEGKAVGYILAAEDIETFLKESVEDRKAITDLSKEHCIRAETEWNAYLAASEKYPAHLHIDILEEYTGRGNGTALMNTLLARLREDGVRGVILGVSSANERAISFYKKMGFEELAQFDGGYMMGMQLEKGE